MDRLNLLKPKPRTAEERRKIQTNYLKESRSIRRTQNFNCRRNIAEAENIIENIPPCKNDVMDRKLALQRFRAEKEVKRKAMNEKKKPPFVVGIPHHGFSPILRNSVAEKPGRGAGAAEVRNNRVTRAASRTATVQGNVLKEKPKPNGLSKNAFKVPPTVKVFPFTNNKTVFSFKPKVESVKKLTSPQTPTVLKRSAKKPLKNMPNLVNRLNKSPGQPSDEREVLAAPLQPEEAEGQEVAVGDVSEKIEPNKDLYGTTDIVKKEDNENKENLKDDHRNLETTCQQELHQSIFPRPNPRRNPRRSLGQEKVGVLPATPPTKVLDIEVKGDQAVTETRDVHEHNTSGNTACGTKQSSNIDGENEDEELVRQVKFQHDRVQLEATRLLELADRWQAVAVRESLPQEVVDEVDSVVGQTRLLTSDKFQQFRRLIVDYEKQTGTHPVKLDDLNGFWEMVYLQVASLDKKYATLDVLQNNNWVRPEPPSKRRRRPVKPLKTGKEKASTAGKETKQNSSHQPEGDQPAQRTEAKSFLNVLNINRRTRSNSPVPYIAMRLSGVGRTPTNLIPLNTGTPRSTLVSTIEKLKIKEEKVEEIEEEPNEEIEEEKTENSIEEMSQPAETPRRSMRIMEKMLLTPASCSVCDSATKDSARHPSRSANIGSKTKQQAKKHLKFSPIAPQQKTDCATVADVAQEEAGSSKTSNRGVKFSLRPSILTVSETLDVNKNPKKTSKRQLASVCFTNMTMEQDAESPVETKIRRSTRQSKAVTFEVATGSGAEKSRRVKLPPTPYSKAASDA